MNRLLTSETSMLLLLQAAVWLASQTNGSGAPHLVRRTGIGLHPIDLSKRISTKTVIPAQSGTPCI